MRAKKEVQKYMKIVQVVREKERFFLRMGTYGNVDFSRDPSARSLTKSRRVIMR